MATNRTNATIIDYIYDPETLFEDKKATRFKRESNENLILPLRVITLLIAVSGLFSMVFEVRHFSKFSLDIYFTRLSATVISFAILTILYSRHALKRPILLVHILLMTIICSSGYMIYRIPSTLIVNSQIVGLMIFTSALFLSWELKHQIIVAIYYNIVFASAILLNDRVIYFLPNMYESVLFVLFLSIISVIGSAVNYRLRVELADQSFRVKLSEKKFRSIFEHSAEGIFQTSPEGKFLTVNPSLVTMLGYASEEELKKADIAREIYFSPTDRDRLLTILLHKGEISNYRLALKRKDGSRIIVRAEERLIRDENDEKIYLEGSITDITQQAILEEEQLKIREELEFEKLKSDQLAREAVKSSEIKSQFLANMSHEIRTPINGVIGFLTLIESGAYKDKAELEDFITTAKTSAETLLDLVNDILDFSKIEAGKMELEEIRFSFQKVVNDALSMVAPRAHEKGLRVVVDIDKHLPSFLLGDSTRLRQIFLNLLSNAVKFTSKGEIRITVQSEKIGNEKVKILSSVKDSGVGIPEEKIAHLFQPFSQVDGSHTRKFGGTGLGLVICKELANMMNGSIWVESDMGKGSTFSFTCVLKYEKQASFLDKLRNRTTPEPSKQTTSSVVVPLLARDNEYVKLQREKFNILVAEDNAVNKKVVLRILEAAGFPAQAVSNGLEALQTVSANRQKYNLILMDVQMPEMDGFTATQQIRLLGAEMTRLPIVALTAHAQQSDREKCLAAGMSDYLSKPIKNQELVTMLDKWLEIDHSGPSAPQPIETEPVVDVSVHEDFPEIVEETVVEAAPVQNDVEIFNLEHFKTISLDDPEFKKELLNTFISDTQKRLDHLRNSFGTGDIHALISESHTIKGASYSIGATAMGDIAKEIEFAGKNSELENMNNLISRLSNAYEDLVSVLQAYL